MLFLKNNILTLLCILASHSLFSSNTDTAKTIDPASITKLFTANQFEYNDSTNERFNSLFITLDGFQKYIPKNYLGNTGMPFNDLAYKPFSATTGFSLAKNNFRNYFFTPQNLKFYNTHKPYTDLFYIIGTKREQLFNMTFSYNVRKNWNITAAFYRIRSEGTYLRQASNDNFVSFSTNFKSENNRYWVIGSVIYNSAKVAENGGIVYDTAFTEIGARDKKLLKVNLNAAKRAAVNRNVFVEQIFNLGKRSADTALHNAIIPGSRFILTSSFDDDYLKYEDDSASAGYYSNIYYDSTKTFDSLYSYKIENALAWKRTDNGRHSGLVDLLGAGFSVSSEIVKVKQREIDTTFNNLSVKAEFFNTYSKHKLWWNVNGIYFFNGYNKEDYNSSIIIKKSFYNENSFVQLTGAVRSQEPDFIYNKFFSNNFKWTNNFEKMQQASASLSFTLYNKKESRLKFDVGYDKYTNVLYFDTYAIARQYSGSIGVVTASLTKDFAFWNWHLNNHILYQYVPDSSVIRLPELVLEHSLYYENNVLHGAARIEVGASVFYNSAFYSNAYMPATGEFYLQNDKKYGNYPFIDFFLNAKIKTVRVFLKIDHLNSGWFGNRYMITPHYPYQDRSFKLGISWKFFD